MTGFSKCVVCKKPFVEGDIMHAFLRSPDDILGSWTTPLKVDKDFQSRHLINQDKISRKHESCNLE